MGAAHHLHDLRVGLCALTGFLHTYLCSGDAPDIPELA